MKDEMEPRGYGVGVQMFDWLRQRGGVYVDKSEYVYVDQILTKDYAIRLAHDARPVVAVGLNISQDWRTIDDYKIVHVK